MSTLSEQWLDGTAGRIFTRHWEPDGEVRANLVICHGVNSHGGQYIRAAEEFASRGIAVTALDLRGRGKSDGERFYAESVDDYVSDLSLAVELGRSKHPDLPVYLLGHSAGGVTSVSYSLDYQDRIAGLICESFAFRVFAPDFALKLLEGASHVAPHAHVLRLKMEDFSRDPNWVARLNADPLTLDEVQPVATVAALARAGERFEREFGRITLPVLILHGTADHATRPDGSEQFFREAGSSDKTLKLYDGHYHDLLNDLGREKVLDDIVAWIDARLTAEVDLPMAGPVIAS
ncbi:alpha/beta hydrolase [Sphingomonas daechungensis]|uniref:Alpha/beta hydrolase n=1 Tax=Sphingomonas daechungensis TaxID=1176646 RepID=A0ABX6T426_9SPHN|nr:alpha/beta hydrolase [Sphingomonas daechungensis]QNP44189.1 alpha/beta hydrolase [Sphingomonas daechungensis]